MPKTAVALAPSGAGFLGIAVVLGLVFAWPQHALTAGQQSLSVAAATSTVDSGGLQPLPPATAASQSPPTPDRRQAIKRMLYQAAVRHGVNAGLVMGLAWWESGWDQSQVSSTGAIGIMQIEPYTADSAGPRLLHQRIDITQALGNIELGTAILRENLDRWHGNLVPALVAYYAGPTAVTDWSDLPPDVQRYVTGIYSLAVAFDSGRGPA